MKLTRLLAVPRFLVKMEKTLHDLGGIVLNGLPTFFLVLILAFCVKYLYLGPLEKVLAERFRLTDGAQKAAEDSLKSADAKIAEYEAALGAVRNDIYLEQAEFLKQIHEEQAGRIRTIREESDKRVASIRETIAKEAETARNSLAAQSDTLAAQIADAILERTVA